MTAMQKALLLLGTLAFSAIQTGCGLKGDLYMPDKVEQAKIKEVEKLKKEQSK